MTEMLDVDGHDLPTTPESVDAVVSTAMSVVPKHRLATATSIENVTTIDLAGLRLQLATVAAGVVDEGANATTTSMMEGVEADLLKMAIFEARVREEILMMTCHCLEGALKMSPTSRFSLSTTSNEVLFTLLSEPLKIEAYAATSSS
jgi:hypothetical protein